jgi:pimeloyl-ACP methyl ester carboxylesterase
VLLAPALDFSGNRLRDLGDRAVDDWRRTDTLNVFHYGFGKMMPVRFSLYEDAAQYDAVNASVRLPIQIFQGRRDTAVDPDTVQRWAEARPQVELHLLDDDHQLIASLDRIWPEMVRFLELPAPSGG